MKAPLDLNRVNRARARARLAAALLVCLAVAVAFGVWLGHRVVSWDDLPDVRMLEEHRPSVITRVFAADGSVIGEFAQERRILLAGPDVPEHLRQALVAVEDAHFYDHPGLNIRGILRAAWTDIRERRYAEGGSSLTQQLARLMFLTPERSITRKIKEAVLAIQLERAYSKDEILTYYCNEVYLGEGLYGVEAAARSYFGKHARELGLAEAALIAGLPQRPNAYSPRRNPEAARRRRDHVLERMIATGYISPDEALTAKQQPVVTISEADTPVEDVGGDYFVEEVRKYVEQHYGEKALYRDGLRIETSLDPELQRAAEEALRAGLLALDKRRGWRGELRNVLEDGSVDRLEEWDDPRWREFEARPGALVPALTLEVESRLARLRIGDWQGELRVADAGWTRRGSLGRLLTPGDLALVSVLAVDPQARELQLALEQEPEVEGALVAIDNRSGEIKAMVGGYEFQRSKFNRAVQAKRQTGSAFKPVVYAAALSSGFTPSDTLFDEPIQIEDPHTGERYEPQNYGRQYYGLTTLREALEKSRNPVTVQLLQKVGYYTVIGMARKLGLTADLQPYPSLALGVFETSLLEMTTAYSTFANNGLLRRPSFIRSVSDRENHVLYRSAPVAKQVIDEDVAYQTTSLLTGVIERGTGRKARSLGRPLAGKTGTTDDFTDAWFIGYSPSLTTGVWVGFDVKRNLGRGEVGAVAALPIWSDFMGYALADEPIDDFVKPAGIEFVSIDRATGRLASNFCDDTIEEAFVRGTAPITYCTEADHELIALPYYLQREYVADTLRSGSAVDLSTAKDATTTGASLLP